MSEKKEKDKYNPFMALILYKDQTNGYYVETRDFIEQNGEYRMGSGSPITKKALANLANIGLSKKEMELGCNRIINYRIVNIQFSEGDIQVYWYLPASKRKLYFKSDLGIVDRKFALPRLIMGYDNGTVKVFAVKDNFSKILKGEDIKLYRAPFLNVHVGGDVCMGNNSIREHSDINNLIEEVQHKFFNSKFTHAIELDGIKGIETVEYYKTTQAEKFDNNLLMSMDKDLEDLW